VSWSLRKVCRMAVTNLPIRSPRRLGGSKEAAKVAQSQREESLVQYDKLRKAIEDISPGLVALLEREGRIHGGVLPSNEANANPAAQIKAYTPPLGPENHGHGQLVGTTMVAEPGPVSSM
jgi:hypothetical protein